MKVPLTVTYSDGTTEDITPTPLAVIGWEKWSGRKITDLSSDSGGIGMADMVRMAWEQVHLSGRTTEDFEAWAGTPGRHRPEGGAGGPYIWQRGSLTRTLVEVSAVTGIPLDSIRCLSWEEIATYVDVLTRRG